MKILEVIIGILALLAGLSLLVLPLLSVFILMLTRTQMDRQWEGWFAAGAVFCWIPGIVVVVIGLIWTRSAIRRVIAMTSQEKPAPISQ
ncbi:MAG: hypothetical protein NTX50_06180 [Candidatus Sumerlaeota bacterium]|nr:hypothetical protein [Candidatus Sumerlaeota bacterium]